MKNDRYLVVGNPIAHSRSPQIHSLFAGQTGDPIEYEKALVELGGFARFADEFARTGGKGMNITVPFKLDAYQYVDQLDPYAKSAGAVNTIAFDGTSSSGYNTDGLGLLVDLQQRHHCELGDAQIIVLGAGGATQGVLGPLLEQRPASITVANRTSAKAQRLVEQFAHVAPAAKLRACGFDELESGADLIINATSVGLSGEFDLIAPHVVDNSFCYDMSYGAAASFARWANEQSVQNSVDGLGMLVEQAAESFKIWRGQRPKTNEVLAQVRATL